MVALLLCRQRWQSISIREQQGLVQPGLALSVSCCNAIASLSLAILLEGSQMVPLAVLFRSRRGVLFLAPPGEVV